MSKEKSEKEAGVGNGNGNNDEYKTIGWIGSETRISVQKNKFNQRPEIAIKNMRSKKVKVTEADGNTYDTYVPDKDTAVFINIDNSQIDRFLALLQDAQAEVNRMLESKSNG